MPKYHLDYDPETKTRQILHTDQDGNAVLESIQDVEDILEYNADRAKRLDKKQDAWFIGTIPNSICIKWAQESNTRIYTKEWMEYARKQVQSSDYSKINPNRIKL